MNQEEKGWELRSCPLAVSTDCGRDFLCPFVPKDTEIISAKTHIFKSKKDLYDSRDTHTHTHPLLYTIVEL